jgi:hypothetical protein
LSRLTRVVNVATATWLHRPQMERDGDPSDPIKYQVNADEHPDHP